MGRGPGLTAGLIPLAQAQAEGGVGLLSTSQATIEPFTRDGDALIPLIVSLDGRRFARAGGSTANNANAVLESFVNAIFDYDNRITIEGLSGEDFANAPSEKGWVWLQPGNQTVTVNGTEQTLSTGVFYFAGFSASSGEFIITDNEADLSVVSNDFWTTTIATASRFFETTITLQKNWTTSSSDIQVLEGANQAEQLVESGRGDLTEGTSISADMVGTNVTDGQGFPIGSNVTLIDETGSGLTTHMTFQVSSGNDILTIGKVSVLTSSTNGSEAGSAMRVEIISVRVDGVDGVPADIISQIGAYTDAQTEGSVSISTDVEVGDYTLTISVNGTNWNATLKETETI